MVQYQLPTRSLQPVLDIRHWLDGTDRAGTAREFDRICREIGFFYLTGHGVPEASMQGILDAAKRFFALPVADKTTLKVNAAKHGYEPLSAQALDLESPPDLKESFLMGHTLPENHPYLVEQIPNYGSNLWPQESLLPGFRRQCEAYFAQVSELSCTLMSILAMAAGLPEDHFSTMLRDPIATLRLLHYPPQPAQVLPNQIGCGAHTDWGSFTILLQDDTGGLEVETASGEWLLAEPLPGAFVINLGDMMPVWSNGAYHSNLHRVRNRSPQLHRYSVPFFQDLNHFSRIECLPAFRLAGETPRHAPRTAGEHIATMYARTRDAAAAY